MNYIVSTIFLWSLLCESSLSFGVSDWSAYSSMKNKDGIELKDLISDFKRYGEDRTKKEKLIVVVVGCVARPGVYEISSGETLDGILRKAGLISVKQHPAHSFVKGVVLYRAKEEKKIDLEIIDQKGMEIENGDVLNIKCVVL